MDINNINPNGTCVACNKSGRRLVDDKCHDCCFNDYDAFSKLSKEELLQLLVDNIKDRINVEKEISEDPTWAGSSSSMITFHDGTTNAYKLFLRKLDRIQNKGKLDRHEDTEHAHFYNLDESYGYGRQFDDPYYPQSR